MTRRHALVTGASRGIGLGLANLLAERGYDLTITSRDEQSLEAVAPALEAHGVAVKRVVADMSSEPDIDRLVDLTGRSLDALVLSAGVGTSGAFSGYPLRRYDKQFAVNTRATFQLISRAMPLLREAAVSSSAGARVIAIASMGAVYPEAGLAAYGASKAAVVSMCQALNMEESKNGVSACAVSPGFVDTEMTAWAHDVVAPEDMIKVEDVVSVVGGILSMSRNAVVSHIVLSRSGENQYTP